MALTNYTNLSKEELFQLAGLDYDPENAYNPARIGKNGKPSAYPTASWFDMFREVSFKNTEELLALKPESVSVRPVSYIAEDGGYVPIENRRAIVGDETATTYAINSDQFQPVQNATILEGLAYACTDTDVSVFGHTSDDGRGRFNAYAMFANPEFHVKTLDTHADPYMMGVRVFNSHNADTRFGCEVMGIRMICTNLGVHGDILGNVSVTHRVTSEDIGKSFGNVINGYMKKIPTLIDLIHDARQEIIETPDLQADLLAGVGLDRNRVGAILNNRFGLNPEAKERQMSVYDLYNASTAYVSHRVMVGGVRAENSSIEISERIERLLAESANVDALIKAGREKRALWDAQDKAKNAVSAVTSHALA